MRLMQTLKWFEDSEQVGHSVLLYATVVDGEVRAGGEVTRFRGEPEITFAQCEAFIEGALMARDRGHDGN